MKTFIVALVAAAASASSAERALQNKGWSPKGKLGLCQGDCDSNKDCKSGLVCFTRGASHSTKVKSYSKNAYEAVPGCSGKGTKDMDYCVAKKKADKYEDDKHGKEVVSYKKWNNRDGIPHQDIKCSRSWKSHAQIQAACTANKKCGGFTKNRGKWWCLKKWTKVGPKDRHHVFYQKQVKRVKPTKPVKKGHFADLSFLHSMAAYRHAQAARARFVKQHMRLVAHRHHMTLAYFKAHHHAGYVKKLMHRFAMHLKAKIAAHHRAIRAHNAAKKHRSRAARARAIAHRNVRRSHTLHRRAIHAVNAAKRGVHRANKHVHKMARGLKYWRHRRAMAIRKRQAALRRAHHWLRILRKRRAHLKRMIHHQKLAAAADRRAAAAARRAWNHRRNMSKKLGFSKVAFRAAMRKFKASKAAAIRANNKVYAHMAKGHKHGLM